MKIAMKNKILLTLTFIFLVVAPAMAADKSAFYFGGIKLSLSNITDEVSAGYYDHQFLSERDADLTESNIKNGVTIFGKAGTYTAKIAYGTGAAKTGQRPGMPAGAPFMAGDDCSYASPEADDIGYPRSTGSWANYNSERFTNNGDGTVTDNATGLMWVQNPSSAGIGATYNWASAIATCEALDYASHTDWRLPNIKELISIVDYGRYSGDTQSDIAMADKTYFPGIQANYYWSSTIYTPNTGGAIAIHFGNGDSWAKDRSSFYHNVIAVRGGLKNYAIGQSYGGGIIFYVDGTGQHGLIATPSDQSSGTTWWNGMWLTTNATGSAVGTGQSNTTNIVNAQGAGTYAASICDSLVLNGYTDWYLPSKDEAHLLFLQKNAVGGFLDSAIYWTSTEYDVQNTWYESFTGGTQTTYGKQYTCRVRAIRAF